MTAQSWHEFMELGAKFVQTVDLGSEETEYKTKFADRLKLTRKQFLDRDPDWFEALRKNLGSTNLMNQYFRMRLVDLGRNNPEELWDAINLLWSDEWTLARVDEFTDLLRAHDPKSMSVGGVVGFASILLMAHDPLQYPPYRARAVKKFLKLVDWYGQGADDMPSRRYELLLEALDEIMRLAPEYGIGIVNRLDAQGLLWTVMNEEPDDGWSEVEVSKLSEWREGKRLRTLESKPTVAVRSEPALLGLRAWLVRQNQAGVLMLEGWLEEGYISTRAQYLGSPAPGSRLEVVQRAVNDGYQHIDYSERKARALEYFRFLSLMKPDDFVVTAAEGQLHIGVITGEAEYVEEDVSRLRRTVSWQPLAIPSSDLQAPLPRLLEEQGSVVDLTDGLSVIAPWFMSDSESGPDDEVDAPIPVPQPAVVPKLKEVTAGLAKSLYVGREDLQEIVRLLQTRQQIVFYGPPGTGKTYLAGKIARFLAGEEHGDHVKTVQFHPSYAYEDFFEGYRPGKTEDGSVGFVLEPGPLRRIAAEAAADGNRDKPYFLIIDEMNRGNLAKIFGELYFLLEYRDQSIHLQYNAEQTFTLPPNLFIIGTMNSSDRSIAMVDAAIRRRFAFVELHPQDGLISGMLERFLEANGKPPLRAQLLHALNFEIEDTNRDLMIGPSYFMKQHAETDQGLEDIWKYELLPLLEEQYFGRLSRERVHEKFGLNTIKTKVPVPVEEWDDASVDVHVGSVQREYEPQSVEPLASEIPPA